MGEQGRWPEPGSSPSRLLPSRPNGAEKSPAGLWAGSSGLRHVTLFFQDAAFGVAQVHSCGSNAWNGRSSLVVENLGFGVRTVRLASQQLVTYQPWDTASSGL